MSIAPPVPLHEVRAVVNDNSAELSGLGNRKTLTADTYVDVRKKIMGRVVYLASGLGSDVHLVVHDQTGQWRLVAGPDGQLREEDLAGQPTDDLPAHISPVLPQSEQLDECPVAQVTPLPTHTTFTAPAERSKRSELPPVIL